jgi:hypothetical protein
VRGDLRRPCRGDTLRCRGVLAGNVLTQAVGNLPQGMRFVAVKPGVVQGEQLVVLKVADDATKNANGCTPMAVWVVSAGLAGSLGLFE